MKLGRAFWKTVTWQSFTFVVTMISGRVYYGNWSLSPVAAFLALIFPPLFYIHERIWERNKSKPKGNLELRKKQSYEDDDENESEIVRR